MAHRSQQRLLGLWANGLRVGTWQAAANGEDRLTYDPAWLASSQGRPLSLSLPFTINNAPLRGPQVRHYFDNLLPDSDVIRRRLQARFRTSSTDAFDLLTAIGRDCVGAIQLLPEGEEPEDVFDIQAHPLNEGEIAKALRVAAAAPLVLGQHQASDDDFRISLAGAQEKTAFLWHQGQWCRPVGSTPTTHIFKLPLGPGGWSSSGYA